jgi:multicomponent Na+:H+ antiporter subunit D
MVDLAERLAGRPPTVALSASAFLLLAGFALKTGLFPLFFWLPASYHTAPIAALAALAGLLTKVGFYACLRIFVLIFGVAGAAVVPGLPGLFGVLAAVTMLVSVIAAIAQVDIRRLLGYHIMAQVAYPMVGLALASFMGIAAAIFYMLHTMLVQTGLFLGAGAVARASGSYDMRRCGGLMGHQPLFAGLFALLAFSMIGVPPLSGFWAKFFVIDAAFRGGEIWLAVVALVVGFLTLYSLSKLWSQAFWKSPPRERRVLRRIPPAMILALVLLSACTLGIGLAVEPVSEFVRAAARQMTFAAGAGGMP